LLLAAKTRFRATKGANMKIAALIVGLIGALATAGLGSKWVSDYNANKKTIEAFAGVDSDAVKGVERLRTAGFMMIVLGIAAIGAAATVFKKSKISGGVMLAAAILPALLAPMSLAFSFLLVIAGILALLAKPKPAAMG
jgi:hypothetical protein